MNKQNQRLAEMLIFCIMICNGMSTVCAYSIATPDGYASSTTGGGQATPMTVNTADAFQSAVRNDQPAVIIVKGRLDVGNIRIRSNKTIIGADSGSGLYGGRIKVTGENCIFQNLIFGPSDVDVVELSGASHIFLHKCEFYDGGNGLLDIVRLSDYVTVSWCKFYYVNQTEHNQVTLVGNGRKEDAGKLHVTMHHNWFAQGCRSVMPSVSYGQVHIYNNYYSSAESEFCIGIGGHSRIRVENTCFDHVKGAWIDRDGMANDAQMGRDGLKLVNTSTPLFAPNLFPVFSLPYSYSMDPVDHVKDIVMAGAGNVFSGDSRGSEGSNSAGNSHSIVIDSPSNNQSQWSVTDLTEGHRAPWDDSPVHVSDNALFLQFSDGRRSKELNIQPTKLNKTYLRNKKNLIQSGRSDVCLGKNCPPL